MHDIWDGSVPSNMVHESFECFVGRGLIETSMFALPLLLRKIMSITGLNTGREGPKERRRGQRGAHERTT
jgi:hypothetical protein